MFSNQVQYSPPSYLTYYDVVKEIDQLKDRIKELEKRIQVLENKK